MTETTDVERYSPPAAPAYASPARENTDSWIEVVRPVIWYAEQIAGTEFVPAGIRGKSAAVAAAILFGRSLDLDPMQALTSIHVIEGRPSLSAEAIRARVYAAGHDLEFTETTGATCTARGRRKGSNTWQEVTWTKGMADAAGLSGKNNWKKHPRQMLQARASAELCRLIFPDVVAGLGSMEELIDEGGTEDQAQPATAIEGPKTTVSRAPAKKAAPAPRQAPKPASSTTAPKPLEVEIPMPDAPAPSGPVPSPIPGPEVEDQRTDAEVVAQAAAEAPELPQDAEVIEHVTPRVTPAQLTMLGATWTRLGITERQDRIQSIELLIGHRLEGGTSKFLTKAEASKLIDRLSKLKTQEQLDELIQAALATSRGEVSD